MPGAEECNGPHRHAAGLEEEFDSAAARHADIGLQIPIDKLRRLLPDKHLLRKRNRLRFQLPAADRAMLQPRGRNNHLAPRILRRGARRFNQRHHHMRRAGGAQFETVLEECE